jgi:hypothetical protein
LPDTHSNIPCVPSWRARSASGRMQDRRSTHGRNC